MKKVIAGALGVLMLTPIVAAARESRPVRDVREVRAGRPVRDERGVRDARPAREERPER